MDTLRHLVGYFIKIAFAFFLFAFVWWLVSLLFPSLSFKSLVPLQKNASTTEGILPSPRKYAGLFGSRTKVQDEHTNVYTPSLPYNGYTTIDNSTYTYSQYTYANTSSGNDITPSPASNKETSSVVSSGDNVIKNGSREVVLQGPFSPSGNALPVQAPTIGDRSLTIRNLSLYEGGAIYTGLSFVGEAKATMFREGKFPIVLLDASGRVIGVSSAVATNDWAPPGWTRFETKLNYPLPKGALCTFIFEEALTQSERISKIPLRVPLKVKCM
jgi:hypothetical protein